MKDTHVFTIEELKIALLGKNMSPYDSWINFATEDESSTSKKLLKKYNNLSKSYKKDFDKLLDSCFNEIKDYLFDDNFSAESSIIEDSIEKYFVDFLE